MNKTDKVGNLKPGDMFLYQSRRVLVMEPNETLTNHKVVDVDNGDMYTVADNTEVYMLPNLAGNKALDATPVTIASIEPGSRYFIFCYDKGGFRECIKTRGVYIGENSEYLYHGVFLENGKHDLFAAGKALIYA